MQFRLSSALGPQSTANKNEINYVETFRAVSPAGYVVINTKWSGHATGQPRTSPPPPPCFVAPSTRTASEPRACQKLSTCPKLNFKKNFIYDCHLRCQRRVSGQLLPLRFGLVRVWSGLVWSGPEPRSVPIVVFINLISTVAFSMFPAPEAASSRSRSSRDRSSRDSSCGQLWWSNRSFGIEQFPFCGLLRLT